MAKQKANQSQLNTTRQDNGSAGTPPTKKVIGWDRMAWPGGAGANVTKAITFLDPFPAGVIPVVRVSFGGDSASSSVTPATAGNTIEGHSHTKSFAATNTGFTVMVHAGGATTGAGYLIVNWEAEG